MRFTISNYKEMLSFTQKLQKNQKNNVVYLGIILNFKFNF